MVTSDPQGIAWSVELRSSGRVTADIGRARSLVQLLGSTWLGAPAVGLLVFTGTWGRILGATVAALAVLGLVMSVQQLLRVGSWRSPQVVVDDAGVTVRHGYLRVPWADLYGAVAYTLSHNRWVALTVTPECYDAWLASRSWLVRLLGRRRRRSPYGGIQLPPNLAVDTEAFAAWLTHETRDRQVAELDRLRRGLEERIAEARRAAELSVEAGRPDSTAQP